MFDDTTGTDLVASMEAELRAQAHALLDPQEGECVVCFTARAVDELGCDTSLRWTIRFRDLRVPSATGLELRLERVGAFCDCEITLNGYRLVRELCERDVHTDELGAPARRPYCAGVRRSSSRPCLNWERQRR